VKDDSRWMGAALMLARQALGNVAPNPAVGCILVKDGIVLGRGRTQQGGRPHAETVALAMAGAAAVGSTAYVTLEPCNHHGKTGPCSEALIAAGIARAVVACKDPDPRVAGGGLQRLAAAGVEVETGVREAEAKEINEGFILRITEGRPLVTLKAATSLDGRIAAHTRASKWVTGEPARARGHLLRAQHDAILVGSATARDDDPELTCRLPGLEQRSPVRIVLDGRLRLALTSRLVRSARQAPVWVMTLPSSDAARQAAFRDCGVELIPVAPDAGGSLDLVEALQALGKRGITRLLVEGGSRVAASFLRAGLADRLAWFRAPTVIGGDGVPVAASFGIDAPDQAPRFKRVAAEPVGEDLLETYRVERERRSR
jgi:diaminohydroxyphosphoribosylaminopyrimidine deaminase/5-amino-6-(5-phosphoribosylamino)uracil reductase